MQVALTLKYNTADLFHGNVAQSGGKGEDFQPFTLDGRDRIEFRQMGGGFIVERHVRSEEVVVGNKQCSKRDSAVEGIEAIGRFDMMFIGSI